MSWLSTSVRARTSLPRAALRQLGIIAVCGWLWLAACDAAPAPEASERSPAATGMAPAATQDVAIGYTAEGYLYAGAADAPVTVYEMFNANCPGCGRHHVDTLDALLAEFGAAGLVRFVLVDLPIGPAWGEEAHYAAYCLGTQQGAAAQWRFWQDFYAEHGRWFREGAAFAQALAETAGLEAASFHECLRREAPARVHAIQARAEAELLPARWATPVFRIENHQGRWLNTLTGSPPLDGWRQELTQHLKPAAPG